MLRYLIEYSEDNGATWAKTTIDPFVRELTAKRTAELMTLSAKRAGVKTVYRSACYKLSSAGTSYETLTPQF